MAPCHPPPLVQSCTHPAWPHLQSACPQKHLHFVFADIPPAGSSSSAGFKPGSIQDIEYKQLPNRGKACDLFICVATAAQCLGLPLAFPAQDIELLPGVKLLERVRLRSLCLVSKGRPDLGFPFDHAVASIASIKGSLCRA